jgi:hypothetical protein
MEATGGFEPPNKGFADLSLNHLGTSPVEEEILPNGNVATAFDVCRAVEALKTSHGMVLHGRLLSSGAAEAPRQ